VDQKFTSAGTMVSAVIMFFAAFIMLPLGLGFLFSYPEPLWWFGPLLLFGTIALTLNGISNIKLSKKLAKEAEEDAKVIAQQLYKKQSIVQAQPLNFTPATEVKKDISATENLASNPQPQTITNDTIVLVNWKYTEDEWKRFTKWEVKERKTNSTIEAALIVILGTLFVGEIGDLSWWVSLIISVLVALIYWLGKYFLSMASIGRPKGKNSEVVITQYAVIINGKYNAFRNDMYRPGPINIKEDCSPKVLEIIYNWSTRKGSTHDEIRIPIPEGKLEEAQWLARTL
jgi:hypothetical protein